MASTHIVALARGVWTEIVSVSTFASVQLLSKDDVVVVCVAGSAPEAESNVGLRLYADVPFISFTSLTAADKIYAKQVALGATEIAVVKG